MSWNAARLNPIGCAAPGSAPLDPDAFDRGLAALAARGLDIRRARMRPPEFGYLAGPDAERAIEVNAFLRDATVRVVFCVRGGYGSLRILDRIDYEAARTLETVFVGYSDVTAIQLALLARAGSRSISGPMVAVEWGDAAGIDSETERLFRDVLQGTPPFDLGLPEGTRLSVLRPGSATGGLVGGNLSILSKLVGTPFMPDLAGAILFLEEVGEPPYRVDGCLAQLRHAGILEELGGVVLGCFTEADPRPGRPSRSLEEVFADYFDPLACPVVGGLEYGHVPRKASVPIGVRARLETSGDAATLTILDPVLR